MADDPLRTEYYKLVDLVTDYDKRLLTVKGWGVTLSLAALGLGFQHKEPGFFLVAAASAVAFWIIEGSMKSHQMRYYPRMREIEVLVMRQSTPDEREYSSPRIDWSWAVARQQLLGKHTAAEPTFRGASIGYKRRYFLTTVMFPHLITFCLATLLSILGYAGEISFHQ